MIAIFAIGFSSIVGITSFTTHEIGIDVMPCDPDVAIGEKFKKHYVSHTDYFVDSLYGDNRGNDSEMTISLTVSTRTYIATTVETSAEFDFYFGSAGFSVSGTFGVEKELEKSSSLTIHPGQHKRLTAYDRIVTEEYKYVSYTPKCNLMVHGIAREAEYSSSVVFVSNTL